jgi:large subunit ribosomal protein L6
MSRIGNRKLVIPTGVEVTIDKNLLTVKGPKGELKLNIKDPIKVEVKDGLVHVTRPNDVKTVKQLHGTMNSLIENMIIGVTKGFERNIEAVGVGYRFNLTGNKVGISAGFSHPVEIEIPSNLTVKSTSNTELTISGNDKKSVSDFAAKLRSIREPEPYKGKGIRYKEEHVRRKEGKKAAK